MDKLITPVRNNLVGPKHHSLADWDFQPGAVWDLSTEQYISEPKSLHMPSTTIPGQYYGWVMLKESIDPNIAHGIMISWSRKTISGYGYLQVYFRAQSAPPAVGGPVQPDNCYYWQRGITQDLLYKRVSGVSTHLATLNTGSYMTPNNTWYHTLWQWSTENVGGADVMRFIVQKEENGVWVTKGTFDHSENLWASSSINRVGFSGYACDRFQPFFWDNTEIYKRNY